MSSGSHFSYEELKSQVVDRSSTHDPSHQERLRDTLFEKIVPCRVSYADRDDKLRSLTVQVALCCPPHSQQKISMRYLHFCLTDEVRPCVHGRGAMRVCMCVC